MSKSGRVFIGLIAGLLLAFLFLWVGPTLTTLTAVPNQPAEGSFLLQVSGTEATPTPGDEVEPPNPDRPLDGVQALATPVAGETLVYFVPTDNDATATVLYLYNTANVTRTVALRGYDYNGVLVYSLSITLEPYGFKRLLSDSVAASPPPSWATPAPLITNFTDFTYLASLSLPAGVKVEGYTLFNGGTGTIDPRVDQGSVPLRFSTDPATLFLPAVQNNP